VTTWLDQLARRADSADPAVVTAGGTWSGRDLLAGAAGMAGVLDAAGAEAGAPVVALVSSSVEAAALAIACAATDRALAPLGPRLTEAELVPCVDALDGSLLVVDEGSDALGTVVATRTGRRVLHLPRLEDVEPAAPLRLEGHHDQVAAILHTSGTTGLPKAVRYTMGPLAARVEVNAHLVELGPGAVYGTASPFHHIAGLGMLLVALGSGAALAPMAHFDVREWRALADLGVTHALAVPTMIEMLLDAEALALPDLSVLQYGASPIRPATLARTVEALPGVRLVNIFGQTEGSPITCLTPEDHQQAAQDRVDLLASVGRAAPGVELVIHDPDAQGIGEVHARAAHFFGAGADGWLRTGDLGHLDDSGYLFLSGRKGDLIIRGGENVYPAEVEAVLASHPDIAEVCVYAVPDARLGETVAAAVVPVGGTSLDWDQLTAYARAHLAGFKVPHRWERRDELPRNHTGKVLRRVLATETIAG
jgi:acyl-CoA synthetase (AMP-forming)/AMP-acid ligase II